jgi:hypothetical protein
MNDEDGTEELDELEDDADDMEERLEEHEAGDDEVDVPEPGENLNASAD